MLIETLKDWLGKFPRRFRGRVTASGRGPTRVSYRACDGGVYDNQGIQVLLDEGCKAVFVSVAAEALSTVPSPSTWSLFPPGDGVLLRTVSILSERARDLGYRRLMARHELYCMLQGALKAGLQPQQFRSLSQEFAPMIEGFAYIELKPSLKFQWQPGSPRLPDDLIPPVSAVRTDLDRFSKEEISALMFHGYTLTDHCLRAYLPNWINLKERSNFKSAVKYLNIDWNSVAQSKRYLTYLDASDSHFLIWRDVKRGLGALKNRIQRIVGKA